MNDVLAALDLGTNSFHMVVARRTGDEGFEVVSREKEVVRLGRGGGDMKEMSSDAMDRAIACLRRMRRIAESHGVVALRAVATSAVREADERRRLHPPRQRGGAGRDRGDLGTRRGTPDPPRCAPGGAGVREAGADRRHRRRVDRDPDRRAGRDARRPQLQARSRPADRPLLPGRQRHRRLGDRLSRVRPVGRSPTSTARSRRTASRSRSARRAPPRPSLAWCTRRRGEEPLRTYNCFEFTAKELHAVVDQAVSTRPRPPAAKLAGLEPDRADIAPAGAVDPQRSSSRVRRPVADVQRGRAA